MVRFIAFAIACALALWGAPSVAAVYSGTFPTGDSSTHIDVAPTAAKLEFNLKSDLADVTLSADLYGIRVFYGTFLLGPDGPRVEYGDDYPIDILFPVGPTGFDQVVDPHWSPCNPFQGPAYFCEHEEFHGLYLDASNGGPPVNWDLHITAVPEPQTWASMILGFGFAGALLRRRRGARAISVAG